MPSQRKIDIVEKLKEKVGRAKGLVFADYQGLTHKQLEELKKALKTVDAELVVTKNTLLKRALETSNYQLPITNYQLPTATLFSYSDALAATHELAKTIRMLKLPAIKFGIFEGKVISAEQVLRLATLPSRDALLVQLVSQMKGPVYKLHRALNWNMQKLVLTLKAVENKKTN